MSNIIRNQNNKKLTSLDKTFVQDVNDIINSARQQVYTIVNNTMVDAYWRIGERIVKQEQGGKTRAEYGKRILAELAEELSAEYDKGFDERELRRMRQFYTMFPIRETVSPELSWSHYVEIIRVDDSNARNYYIAETISNHWGRSPVEKKYFYSLLRPLACIS